MGVVQKVASTPGEALQAGIEVAEKIAACGPLGIRATLDSAHLAFNASEGEAFSKLETQYRGLYGTEDFKKRGWRGPQTPARITYFCVFIIAETKAGDTTIAPSRERPMGGRKPEGGAAHLEETVNG